VHYWQYECYNVADGSVVSLSTVVILYVQVITCALHMFASLMISCLSSRSSGVIENGFVDCLTGATVVLHGIFIE